MFRAALAILLLILAMVPLQAQQRNQICAPGADNVGVGSLVCQYPSAATDSALVSATIIKSSAATVTGFQTNNTSTGTVWMMLLDTETIPAVGSTLVGCDVSRSSDPCVAKWFQIPTLSTASSQWTPPLLFRRGVVAICSNSGPFLVEAGVHCVFSYEVN